MNIAIGNKTFGRNFRFGVGAFVTALSVATIVGVGIWHLSDSPSQPTANAPVTAPVVRPVESGGRAITPVHYYLVNSDDQISALDQALFEADANLSGGVAAVNIYTIDVRTPEGQELARALQEDLYLAATLDSAFDASLVQVHDLTVGPARPISKARSEFVPSAGQAAIYIVGSEAERQQLLNEADVAAAVEGGEFLNPTVVVIDASDPEALQLEATITEERLNGGANIIDLR